MEATLLALCEATPDDDEPRMMWADHVGGERGELVHVQCALARGGLSPQQSGALRVRQRELLVAHGREWSGLAEWAVGAVFRRGFVELAMFEWPSFVAHAEAAFAAAPFLTSIDVHDTNKRDIREIVDHPSYARVRGLDFPLGDASLKVAIDRRAFAKLEALDVYAARPPLIQELAASDQLTGIRRLALFSNLEVLPLQTCTPELRALDLHMYELPSAYYTSLPSTLTELSIRPGPVNTDLEHLTRTPIAGQLERLALYEVHRSGAMPALGAFAKLRSLDLHMASEASLDILFANSPLPMLRELRCSNIGLPAAERLAEKLGPQLELLELSNFEPGPHMEHTRSCVAGELRLGHADTTPPLFAGEIATAPMWDYPIVKF